MVFILESVVMVPPRTDPSFRSP